MRRRKSFYHQGKDLVLYDVAHRRFRSALKSPQILVLFDIGRRDVLQKIGVSVELESEGVGENAQEHIWAGVTFRS